MSFAKHQLISGALSLLLGALLWFWLIPNWVQPDPDLRLPVSLVPQIIALGFVLCGVAAMCQGIFAKRVHHAKDDGFDPGETHGFVIMLLLLLGATFGFQFAHFLIVAPIMVALAMWMFGPVHPISLIVTSCLGPLLIWFIGTEILGRVLP